MISCCNAHELHTAGVQWHRSLCLPTFFPFVWGTQRTKEVPGHCVIQCWARRATLPWFIDQMSWVCVFLLCIVLFHHTKSTVSRWRQLLCDTFLCKHVWEHVRMPQVGHMTFVTAGRKCFVFYLMQHGRFMIYGAHSDVSFTYCFFF